MGCCKQGLEKRAPREDSSRSAAAALQHSAFAALPPYFTALISELHFARHSPCRTNEWKVRVPGARTSNQYAAPRTESDVAE